MTETEINRWFEKLPRVDDKDYSHVQCSCGDTFSWCGFDERLSDWKNEHFKHSRKVSKQRK